MSSSVVNEKYRIAVDIHCHTYASFHAMCTISEVIQLAKQRGLDAIAVTDHHPSLDYPEEGFRIRSPDFAYFNVFCERFQNMDPDIVLLKGIELNLLDHEPWVNDLKLPFFKRLDIRLAGIHVMNHLFNKSSDLARNTKAIVAAFERGDRRPFEVMTHPIINGVKFEHKAVIDAAKRRKIAFELNNSFFLNDDGLTSNRMDVAELITFFEKIAEAGGQIAVGSDAHVPHEVGKFDGACAFLARMNFPEQLIINRSLEGVRQFCLASV